MAGEAFRLVIPQDMLNKLDAADEKLQALGDTSKKTGHYVQQSFGKMIDSVQAFINKVGNAQLALHNLGNFKGNDIKLGNVSVQATQNVDAINKLIDALVKLKMEQKKSGGTSTKLSSPIPTPNVEGWTKLQQSITQSEQRVKQLTQSTREYEETMKRIQSGKGGVVSKQQQEQYKLNKSEIEELNKSIALQRQKQQEIISQNNALQAQARLREQLRNFEMNRNSLPNQRQNAEMQQLNAYYRELEKTSKKEEERRIKEEQRSAKNAEKIAKDEERKAQAAERAREREAKAAERSAERERRARERISPSTISGGNLNTLLGASNSAVSINQMLTSIKNLEKAKKDLDTTDKNYKKTLAEIDNAINKNKQSLRRLGVETENVRKHQSNLMNHAQQLRRALALVFSVSQITGYINKMVQVRGEFELQQRSLQAILQNKDEADKLWQQTVDLAVRSPFRVKELVSYTKQLAAYRIETEKLHDTTKMLSDVSAGLGVDMQRLILAYGQVKAANYLRGTELRQFSEAGINILGELAKYFTELEGRAVSVGEVFERVSKRMVAFSDVDEIFKRVTSEGGVFYRMQEIQSETVKGLISNLYDQVDLMLNDIGKSNDGALKGAIVLTRTLIENWKAVATVLKQVGAIIAAIQLSKFALGLKLAGRGFVALATNMGGATAMAAKLRVGLSSLLATMKAHPILLIVGAIASAVHALWEYNDAIDATNEKYNEMSKREIRRADALGELNEKVLENNKIIKDNNLNAEKQNEALKNNESILAKIKKEYPELYGAIVKQKDGTIDLTEAIKEQNKILERNIALQQQAKAGFFQESQEENYKEVVEAQADLSNALDKVKTAAITAQVEMKALGKDALSEETTQRLTALIDGVKKTKNLSEIKDAFKSVGLYLSGLSGAEGVKAYNIFENIQKNYAIANAKLVSLKNAQKDLLDNFKNQKETLFISLNEIETPEERGKWLEEQLTTLGILDEKVREWAKQEIPKLFPITLDIKYPSKQPLEKIATEWREQYNTFIKSFTTGVVDEIYDDTNTELYINNLKGRIESVNKDIEAWDAGNARARATYTKEQIELMRLENAERKKAYDWLVYNKKQAKKEESEELKNLKKQIQLVRQLADDYEEMWKKYGKTYADANIKSAARRNAFTEVGLDIDDFAVGTRQDEKNNLQKLLPKALGIEGGKIEIEKATADVEVEIAWDLQEDENANLSRELENMFGNYELSLELKKLNIPPDLASQLFGIDTIDLSSLRKEILNKVGLGDMANQTDTQIFDSTAYKNLNEHQQKELAKHLQKVEEMERKAQEERLKTYSKYLVKGMDERVRIKIEELRKLEEVEKDKDVYTPQQRADIRSAIQKEAQEALDKQAWDEFKNTDLYISLFEDLEDASNRSLKIMIERLNSLRESLNDLPPEQLKEIVNQLEKAQDELEGRNPFKKFGNDLKDYFGNIGKRKEAQQGVDDTEKRLTYLRAEAESQRDIIAQYESRQEKGEKLTDREKEHLEMMKSALSLTKQQISNTEKAQQSWQKILDSIKKGADGIGEAFEGTGEFLQSMDSYVTDMANKWEQAFGLSDKAKDDIETIAGVAQGAGDMAIGIGKAMSGDVLSGVMQGVSGLMSIAATIGQAHDKKKERQIEREMKLVERLQKVYDDLGETIQNAYSLDTLNEATQMSRENLMAQINATERMIQAEKDKKDPDWGRIEDWEEQIEEAKEAMKELEETRLQELGAFASDENKKSGAQAFLDAWLEAYKETGNGLSGLNEQFDEFFEDSVKRQMLQKATSKYLDNLFDKYDTAISDWADGKLTDEELYEKLSGLKNDLPGLNEALEKWAEAVGISAEFAGKDAELGGLQAGIQSVSEATADVLASYMSSVRLYVADNNAKFTDLITRLFDSEGSSNPMLAELRAQTAFIQEIRDVLGSVVRGGHSMGGTGLKVFIS